MIRSAITSMASLPVLPLASPGVSPKAITPGSSRASAIQRAIVFAIQFDGKLHPVILPQAVVAEFAAGAEPYWGHDEWGACSAGQTRVCGVPPRNSPKTVKHRFAAMARRGGVVLGVAARRQGGGSFRHSGGSRNEQGIDAVRHRLTPRSGATPRTRLVPHGCRRGLLSFALRVWRHPK